MKGKHPKQVCQPHHAHAPAKCWFYITDTPHPMNPQSRLRRTSSPASPGAYTTPAPSAARPPSSSRRGECSCSLSHASMGADCWQLRAPSLFVRLLHNRNSKHEHARQVYRRLDGCIHDQRLCDSSHVGGRPRLWRLQVRTGAYVHSCRDQAAAMQHPAAENLLYCWGDPRARTYTHTALWWRWLMPSAPSGCLPSATAAEAADALEAQFRPAALAAADETAKAHAGPLRQPSYARRGRCRCWRGFFGTTGVPRAQQRPL